MEPRWEVLILYSIHVTFAKSDNILVQKEVRNATGFVSYKFLGLLII